MNPREWRKTVAALAERYGYTVSKKRSGHFRLDKPGRPPVFTSGTSSDHRAAKNLESYLRREEKVS